MTPAHPKLTKRQNQIVGCIRANIEKFGFPPSIREIGEDVGLSSSSTIHSHLKSLETKGVIKRNPCKPRSITLCETPAAPNSPVVAYHKRVVDFVRAEISDLTPAKPGEVDLELEASEGEQTLAQVLAAERIAAMKNVEEYLLATSPLGGLQ